MQRIREAERDTVYNKYARKLNDLVTGTRAALRTAQHVRAARRTRRSDSSAFGTSAARNFRINDFIRAYVLDVRKSPKGPQVVLSRAAEGLVQRLLEFEVPEIADGIVEIMAIAREAGSRSKVAVRSMRAGSRSDRRMPRAEIEPHRQRFATICAARRSTSFARTPIRKRSS